jgi:hypothetical protein
MVRDSISIVESPQAFRSGENSGATQQRRIASHDKIGLLFPSFGSFS